LGIIARVSTGSKNFVVFASQIDSGSLAKSG